MLGHKLMQSLPPGKFEVTGTLRGSVPRPLQSYRVLSGIQVEDFSSVVRAFAMARPQAVVNCIGLIKQLLPSRRDLVELNSAFPHRLLELCQASGARLVHFSTDCVFSGRQGNYQETSRPDPIDDYGFSKLMGEIDKGGLTLRTSIVGRQLAGGLGLVEWFYARRGTTIKGFKRAIYSGLTTLEMSRVVARVLEHDPDLEGVWHVSSQPINKFDLLSRINQRAGLLVNILPEDDFHCDRSLCSARFQERTGYRAPSWDEMIAEMVDDGQKYAFAG
jgi:dTDP-4-dehydrorhamnose reductase